MFAQTNYPIPQGIPPTRYTIAQVGCLITAFSNLGQRYGRGYDPPAVNAYLRDHGLYIDIDDGVRDDVAWDTITKFDPTITVSAVGGANRPPTNDSIVKFIYNGGRSTHFCLVNDANAGTIIDSWDAKVKSWDVYGGVKAYASYNIGGGSPPPQEDEMIPPTEAEVYAAFRKYAGKEPANPDQVKYYMARDKRDLYSDLLNYEVVPKEDEVKQAFKLYQPWQPINPPEYPDQIGYYTNRPAKNLYQDLSAGLLKKYNAAPAKVGKTAVIQYLQDNLKD